MLDRFRSNGETDDFWVAEVNRPKAKWQIQPWITSREYYAQVKEKKVFAPQLTTDGPGAVEVWMSNSATRITTPFIDAEFATNYPGFIGLSVDSLGKERFPLVALVPPAEPVPYRARCRGPRIEYRRPDATDSTPPCWAIEVESNNIMLDSYWSAADRPEPLVLNFDNHVCHVTLLGMLQPNGSMRLPAIIHFPDQGTFRISTVSGMNKPIGYATDQRAMGSHQVKFVQVVFPGATPENPLLKYRWQVVSIYPPIPDIENDPRFDGFRRNWLNIFQISPHWQTLANNANSDTCAFCYYEYADVARQTPVMAKDFAALDMVRQTLEKIMGGAKTYGMPGFGSYPEYSADTLPSLLIASADYVLGSRDYGWLTTNYDHLKSWTDQMLATDQDGDGLIKYLASGNSGSWPAHIKYRPANWWDTIGFGHEDAYANALAYRALRDMETLAHASRHTNDQARYHAAAEKLRAAYFSAFYDPTTGVLAGWRSSDGCLHDYYFPWVNGIAIHYGLVPRNRADSIMDRLLAKMHQVGYNRFDLGLPGNLVPVARSDYVDLRPRFGGGTNEDNSDGFQIYENGGATACFAYFMLAALYDLERTNDADRIFFPLMESFAAGNFQGRGRNGMTRDWKTWNGASHGYEGFLTDNYYALLAVVDRANVGRPRIYRARSP
jgi:hypothetical protein